MYLQFEIQYKMFNFCIHSANWPGFGLIICTVYFGSVYIYIYCLGCGDFINGTRYTSNIPEGGKSLGKLSDIESPSKCRFICLNHSTLEQDKCTHWTWFGRQQVCRIYSKAVKSVYDASATEISGKCEQNGDTV